ncbi:hypothetical protein ANCCAN_26663 [Ancylostoma caninum]|uniref:Uncharacterized protein n=1 Tax=Ancylostoma caninum TaxID=29170 RepID=A0A368F6A5_ANCCA|nr:hypothetical protein ANCCAN_26663 [Ancylostoma caninum]
MEGKLVRRFLPSSALLYAPSGRRTVTSHQDAESSHANDDQFREERCSSDDEDEIVVVDIVDVPENCSEPVSTRPHSTDQRDHCRDIIQKMEMSYAATRTNAFTALRNPGDGLLEEMERSYHLMEEDRKIMARVAAEATGKETMRSLPVARICRYMYNRCVYVYRNLFAENI